MNIFDIDEDGSFEDELDKALPEEEGNFEELKKNVDTGKFSEKAKDLIGKVLDEGDSVVFLSSDIEAKLDDEVNYLLAHYQEYLAGITTQIQFRDLLEVSDYINFVEERKTKDVELTELLENQKNILKEHIDSKDKRYFKKFFTENVKKAYSAEAIFKFKSLVNKNPELYDNFNLGYERNAEKDEDNPIFRNFLRMLIQDYSKDIDSEKYKIKEAEKFDDAIEIRKEVERLSDLFYDKDISTRYQSLQNKKTAIFTVDPDKDGVDMNKRLTDAKECLEKVYDYMKSQGYIDE